MKPQTSKESSPPSTRRWLLAAAFAVLAGAMIIAAILRTRPATTGAATRMPVKGSYKNRSLFQRTAADAPAEGAPEPAVSGTIYDQSGNLLAGAKVVATTFDLAGNFPTTVAVVHTDERGVFNIPLAEGIYQLNASMEGYGPTSAAARTGEATSLVLPTSGVVKGHVLDEKGKPISRFSIDVVSVVPADMPAPPPLWSRRFESPDGSFRLTQLPAWPVIIRASAEDRAPGFSQPLAAKLDEERVVDLTLAEGCVLTGTVTDRAGAPAANVFVDAEARVVAGAVGDLSAQTANQATSEPDGSFRLEHVPKGTVVVRAYDGQSAVTTLTVEIAECGRVQPIKLTISKGGSISGTARKADGTPLVGARLTLMNRSIGFVNTLSDEQGRYRFDEVPTDSMRLELAYEGQRALQFVHVRDGENVTQDMTLFAPGKGEIRGKVMAGDRPIAGARLMVAAFHGRKQGIDMYFPTTGADGSYRVQSVPEGNYVINVISTQTANSAVVKANDVVTLDLDVGPQNTGPDRTPHAPSERAKQHAPQPQPEADPQQ